VNKILNNTWFILDKKEKKQFVILVWLGIVISIADILALVALLWIIQFYVQPNNTGNLHFLPVWLTDKNSVLLIALFLILFSIKNIIGYLIAKAQYTFTGRVAVRLSRNCLIHYQQAGFDEFVHTDSSVLIRKIALQPFDFSQQVLSGLQQIITQSFLILITVIAILLFNAKLFLLLLLILLPPVIVVFYFIKNRLSVIKNNIRNNNERSYQYLLDALKGYVEGNIYNRNGFFLKRFLNYRRKFSVNLFDSISMQGLPARVIEIFAVLGLFILIVIAKWSGNENSNTLIIVAAFMAAAYKIIPGVVKLINLAGQIKAYEFSADELKQTAHAEENSISNISPVIIDSVDLKNISFQYSGQDVLNHFSFSVKKGDFLGISGASGIGKTTILNVLLGFLRPASGEMLMNDVPVNTTTAKQFWPAISYVRQQSFFMYDTILRNITLEENNPDQAALDIALSVSGLNKLIENYEDGLEKMITENGKIISGGQQQRIAIARALYKKADLLLLDEPFNELDEESTRTMLEHLREMCIKGKIVIMITHDKKSLSFCNKTVSLNEQ
jgi:ABC-type bacteriocin/lantibiotic exporter with double-glycine peptidase domain